MELGGSAVEACEREVWEETGLRAPAKGLMGVYSHPDQLVVYADGNKAQIVALHFEVEIIDGQPALSGETTNFGYFNLDEIEGLDMFGRHRERVMDTLERHGAALIK